MRNERTSSGTPRRTPTVLIVDDDREVREILALALELEGYRVERAVDGLDALLALRTGAAPDAILLDLEMPSMGGPEFRAAQLRDPALARIPVVVLSSSARAVDAQLRLAKPVDLDVLVRAIRELAGPPVPPGPPVAP
jgi:CheY-like chemotaxis protein